MILSDLETSRKKLDMGLRWSISDASEIKIDR